MREIAIGACVIRLWHSTFFETCFPDGATLPSAPNSRPEDRATAAEFGYRGDDAGCYRMWQEHDIGQTWLAVQEGLDDSPTRWHAGKQRQTKSAPGLP